MAKMDLEEKKNTRIETWFPADVYIRQASNDEVRIYRSHEIAINDEWSTFIWENGNFSCDCNRVIFFKKAGNEDIHSVMDFKCSEGLYFIDKIIHVLTGETIYEEYSNKTVSG